MASPTEFHEGRPASLVLSSARRPVRPRLWLWPNLLSLDAPVVAVLWQALFILCFHATVKTLPMVILFCAVWMIYSADRVLDVWRGAGSRPRHEFCRRHWIAASPAFFGVLALTVWMTLAFLPHVFFIRGVCLGSAVIVYFGAVHLLPKRFRGLWPKEAAVAVVFALGISLV
ncbi:MAG TPA: hypothetical protein VFW83_04725, partial [Bryobacteraceae bacterium]|nr:hypothetical protein [Bryobacteraceae bacterium]